MNAHILINAVVQQTMVFIAQLSTAGGVRAHVGEIANQALMDLSNELQKQGVRKNVIADMFGMTLRTYHRKIRALSESRTDVGQTVWEAVLNFIRAREPVSARVIQERLANDEADVIVAVLNDLVHSGITYRSGRGPSAVYRIANAADFDDGDEPTRRAANEHLVWLTVYRNGPLARDAIVQATRLDPALCEEALTQLKADGRVEATVLGADVRYSSDRFDVPVGQAEGWEAAVFDHFQAMVTAVSMKLQSRNARSARGDHVGGATYSLDVWRGHPLEGEVLGTLARVRAMIEDLRARVDALNATEATTPTERVVFYVGQYVRSEE